MEIEASKLEKDVEDDFGNGKFAVVRGIEKRWSPSKQISNINKQKT